MSLPWGANRALPVADTARRASGSGQNFGGPNAAAKFWAPQQEIRTPQLSKRKRIAAPVCALARNDRTRNACGGAHGPRPTEFYRTFQFMPPMAAYHNSSLFSLIFSLQKESLAALLLLYSSFSARYRATKMPLALAWDREWVTPLPSPMTNRPLWGVSRCSSSATSML